MTRPPLVLLHGAGQSPMSWQDVVTRLYGQSPLLTPWVPGARPIDPQVLPVAEAAAALGQQLTLEGVDQADICGISLGAMVALQLAADQPERVRRLVVIAAQVKPPRLLMAMQARLIRLMPKERFVDSGVSKDRLLQILEVARHTDLTDALPRITAPTLVLCGAGDRPNLPAARRIAERIPDATLTVVAGAGHELNEQRPAELAEILTGFLT